MANAKKTKPKAKLAVKWELCSEDKPQPYELPEGVCIQTIELDPDTEIICADCGRAVEYQDSYVSPLIRCRKKHHIGYLVCQPCYFREKDVNRQILEKLMAAKG